MKSTGNTKLDEIIFCGKDLFWKFGIKRVTVEEICKNANVSKMTFYKYFSNKIELAETILDKTVGEALVEFRLLVDSNVPFQEKVEKMFAMKYEGAKNVSNEFVNDLYINQEYGLYLKMQEMGKESMKIFIDFIEDSKKKNLIRKEVNVQFILAYLKNLMHMVEDEELMRSYEKVEDIAIEGLNFLFYGILPRDSKENE